MRSWSLRALTHIRESEARVAMFDARNAVSRAREMEAAAAEVEARARGLRREAAGGGVPNLDQLAMTSARRAGAYRKSRVLGAEAARSMASSRAARDLAGGASALASAARARADALERGEARWMVAERSAREAAREMDAEECWNASRSSSRREQGTD
jgi:hypothetical protein